MDAYIAQLLEDFTESRNKVPTTDQWLEHYCLKNNVSAHEVNVLEFYDDESNFVAINEMLGIEQYFLPTHEKLNETQVSLLHDAIVSLFRAWKIEFLFPESTPVRLRYSLFHESWTSKVTFVPLHSVTYKLCSKDCNSCRFTDYCSWTLEEEE